MSEGIKASQESIDRLKPGVRIQYEYLSKEEFIDNTASVLAHLHARILKQDNIIHELRGLK